jgi:phage baseplate assembly protein W
MSITRISRKFKDISLSFDMHPVTKDILVLTDENAIKRSIRNIVQTVPSEKFFNSTFGSDIKTTLFEFIDFGTASLLQKQVEIAINNYESRVNKVKVEVIPRPDDNAFEINVFFDIIGQDFPSQTFNYILEATR